MTAEERANEVCRLFGIQPAGPDEGDWPHKLQARMAKAIRAAEGEALERVEAHFERLRSTVTPMTSTPAAWAASVVRSLKSRSVKGDRAP